MVTVLPHAYLENTHRDWCKALGSSIVLGSEGMPGQHFYVSEAESNVVEKCEILAAWVWLSTTYWPWSFR